MRTMDSLYVSYKTGPNDIEVHFTKYFSPTNQPEKINGRLSPTEAALLLRIWAAELELRNNGGKFDAVK
jgi:hypothetical protein